jgi:hypothetical protein
MGGRLGPWQQKRLERVHKRVLGAASRDLQLVNQSRSGTGLIKGCTATINWRGW